MNNNQLFIDFNAVWAEVADENTVFGFRAGAGVDADMNLHILEEYQIDGYADVYVDTTVFEYWTDYLDYEDSYIDLGTIAWMLGSTDGGESYDFGTALVSDFAYLNSTYCSSAKNVGVIDYAGKLHFSVDSGMTFSVYNLPGWPFNFELSAPYMEDFTATGFYFNEDLVGFYAPQYYHNSSLYKVDLSTGLFTSLEISTDFIWNRITMIGSDFVIAVGDSGMVATSFDQGETWNVENIGTELDLYGVDFNGDDIIIVGDSGLILTNSAPLVDFIEISSEVELIVINTENGTLQLSATVYPESAPQEVTWSMVNLSGTATIDQNGLVTAQGNGLVMAAASIPEPPGFTEESENKSLSSSDATFFILISGQSLGEQYIFGADTTICGEDVLTVSLVDSEASVEWSDGSSDSFLEISEEGTYWVTVTDGDFVRSDSISVSQQPYPEFSLGEDISFCNGESVTVSAPIEGEYSWSTGSTDSEIFVEEEGWIVLEIFDGECSFEDSLFLEVKPLPEFSLGADTVICDTASIVLEAFVDGATYQWSDGSESPSIEVDEEGEYSVLVTVNGCSSEDEISVGLINCTLSTSKESLEASFKIFPNPATDIVTLEIPEELIGGFISVFSSSGKLVDQLKQNSSKYEWDVSGLSKGIYLIKLNKEGFFFTKELVIR